MKPGKKYTNLVQNAIGSVLHDSDDALGTRPSRRHRDASLAIVTQARLYDCRQQSRPIAIPGLIKRRAEEPGCHGVNGGQGDEVAADVEVRDVIFGEVDGEAPTGRSGLESVIEAYGGGLVEEEVGC